MAKVSFERGVPSAAAQLVGGGLGVTASPYSMQWWVGWSLFSFGVALLMWGIRIHGRKWWRSRVKQRTISYDELGDLLTEKKLLLPGEKEMGGTRLVVRDGIEQRKITPLDPSLPMTEWQFDTAQVERWLGHAQAAHVGGVVASVAFSHGVTVEENDASGFATGLDATHSEDVVFRRNRIRRDEKGNQDAG
jgi:hypothetical protein